MVGRPQQVQIDDRTVWYPCSVSGFGLGKIIDIGGDTFTLQPNGGGSVSV